jgi:hypothetical protein
MPGSDLKATEVPWFWVTVLAGVFTVLGAAIGWFSAWAGDRRKRKQEDKWRWTADIRKGSADVISLSQQLVSSTGALNIQLATAKNLTEDQRNVYVRAVVNERRMNTIELGAASHALAFIAGKPLIDAINDFNDATYALVDIRTQIGADPAEDERLEAAYEQTRTSFTSAVRTAIHVVKK